jgi:hypothetical protein
MKTGKIKNHNGVKYVHYYDVKTLKEAKELIQKHGVKYDTVFTNKTYGQSDFLADNKLVAYHTKGYGKQLQVYI